MRGALFYCVSVGSEGKLQRQLSDAAIPSTSNLPDVAVNIAVRIRELSMIERVEEFGTKFECDSLRNTSVLVEGEIPVVKPWTVEKAPLHIADRAWSVG